MPLPSNFVYRDPTQEQLRARFTYNPQTGRFTFGPSYTGRRPAKPSLGTMAKSGRWLINFDKRPQQANRLAWIWMYGAIPEGMDVGYKVTMDPRKPETCGEHANRAENLVLVTREAFQRETVYRINARMAREGKRTGRPAEGSKAFVGRMNEFDRLLAEKRNPVR